MTHLQKKALPVLPFAAARREDRPMRAWQLTWPIRSADVWHALGEPAGAARVTVDLRDLGPADELREPARRQRARESWDGPAACRDAELVRVDATQDLRLQVSDPRLPGRELSGPARLPEHDHEGEVPLACESGMEARSDGSDHGASPAGG